MIKLVAFLLVALVVLALALFALALGVALVYFVCRLLLALGLAFAVALGAGVAVALLAGLAGADEPATVGFFVGAVALIPALAFSWRRVDPLREEPRPAKIKPAVALDVPRTPKVLEPPPKPAVSLSPPEPKGDEAIGTAWGAAALLAPNSVGRLSTARESCAGLLRKMGVGSASWDGEWVEVATLIRRHIPPLVEETRRACDGADPVEREAICRQLVAGLEALGRRAHDLLERERTAAVGKVAIRHTHIASRLGETRWGEEGAT